MKGKKKKVKSLIFAITIISVLTIIVMFILSDNDSKLQLKDSTIIADDDTSNEFIRMYLERFVMDIRSVPDDELELKINIVDAYLLFSNEYHEELTELLDIDINNPFTLLENNITVEVEFSFIERISEKIWRVQWEETYKIEN